MADIDPFNIIDRPFRDIGDMVADSLEGLCHHDKTERLRYGVVIPRHIGEQLAIYLYVEHINVLIAGNDRPCPVRVPFGKGGEYLTQHLYADIAIRGISTRGLSVGL